MRKSKPLELTYEKDGVDYKIYIFQGRAGKYKFKTVKAVTVALRVIPDEYNIRWNSEYDIWYEGTSVCSNQDQFSVNTGIVKAVGRADSGYCLDAYGQDDGDEYEYDESYLDIATSYATETAKRIDKRNIEKFNKKPVPKSVKRAAASIKEIIGSLIIEYTAEKIIRDFDIPSPKRGLQ